MLVLGQEDNSQFHQQTYDVYPDEPAAIDREEDDSFNSKGGYFVEHWKSVPFESQASMCIEQ